MTEFKHNLRDGTCKYFWENGNLKGAGIFKQGQLNGTWTGFYENGLIERQGEMINGKEEGVWKTWDSSGNPTGIFHFKSGKLLQ